MKKKYVLIPLMIGLFVYIIYLFVQQSETGANFVANVPSISQKSVCNIKSVKLYLDDSGSMKGYVDFASLPDGKEVETAFISTLSYLLDKVSSNYKIQPICKCGEELYNSNTFLDAMEDFSIFRVATTHLHKMIMDLSSIANDSTIAVFASDMILSYGKKKIIESKDSYYNKHQLDQLGAQVHKAMTRCKDKNLHIIVLQYYGHFNGDYYYNCTENIEPNVYKGRLMKNRPFYLMVIGTKSNLENLMKNKCFVKPVNVYSSFLLNSDMNDTIHFDVTKKMGNVGWQIGDPDDIQKVRKGSIMTNADFGEEKSTLTVSCRRFELPGYVNTDSNGNFKIEWNRKYIDKVEDLSTKSVLTYDIKLKPHKNLQSDDDVWIRLIDKYDWVTDANSEDDTKNLTPGKTWGIKKVIENINDVYNDSKEVKPQVITTFSIKMIID